MQVTAANSVREHEKPMSWPRAILIAVGFFFVTGILLGQLSSFVYTVSTLSTLARMEQSFLDMGLLALGLGLMCFEISLLYDPKPLLPWPLFLVGWAGAGGCGPLYRSTRWAWAFTRVAGLISAQQVYRRAWQCFLLAFG